MDYAMNEETFEEFLEKYNTGELDELEFTILSMEFENEPRDTRVLEMFAQRKRVHDALKTIEGLTNVLD
jgi:hypothetical protein